MLKEKGEAVPGFITDAQIKLHRHFYSYSEICSLFRKRIIVNTFSYFRVEPHIMDNGIKINKVTSLRVSHLIGVMTTRKLGALERLQRNCNSIFMQ